MQYGHLMALGSHNVEGPLQVGEFALALVLSAVIGLERELKQKGAGLRTHTLVGAGAALFMLVSKYGFSDVLEPRLVVVDPSRVAAQIVTGVGFLGAGLIFVRQDGVRGLTSAASVWVTAAVGAAAGAGLPLLALVAVAGYLLVALAFPPLTRRLPRSRTALSTLRVRYPDGRGLLREVLQFVTARGFVVDRLSTQTVGHELAGGTAVADRSTVEVLLLLHGRGSVNDLAAGLTELPGVHAVQADDVNVRTD